MDDDQLDISVLLQMLSRPEVPLQWADKSVAEGLDGVKREFDHPFLQAVGMFLGELSCLFVFLFIWLYDKNHRQAMDIGPQKFNPLIFWPASLCDMCATSLMYIGLNLTFASSFQMLRGAVIIFTALLSVAFLGRIVRFHMWMGMSLILVGLVCVGLSDIIFKTDDGSPNGTDMNAVIAGDLLIIMAQIITATQMVYEEKVVRKYDVPPLQAVGYEGLFGFFTLGLLLIPMYYIYAPAPFSKNGRLENALDAFEQMKNNWHIILATVGNIVSIAFFNFSGISVTREISATTRMVLDSCRTVIIWAVSLGVWQGFHVNSFFMQLGGFILLILGMCLYNDIIIRPSLQRYGCLAIPNDDDQDPDEFEPLIGSDPETRRRREVTYGGGSTDESRSLIN